MEQYKAAEHGQGQLGEADAQAYIDRFNAGQERMGNLKSLWKALLFYFLPNSEHLIWNSKTDKGEYDTPASDAGIKAASIMASGIYSYTVSRGTRIADLIVEDELLNEDDSVQEYLSKQITIATQLVQASNYSSMVYDMLRYYCVLGTDLLYSYYDKDLRKLNFRTYRVFDVWMEADKSGRISTLIRREALPHKVAKEKWGFDKLPEEVQTALNDPKTCIQDSDYLHIVEPNPNYIPLRGATKANAAKAKLSKHFKYRQVWVHISSGKVMEQDKGYRTFPYHVARAGVQVNQLPFGRSQAMDALPTARELHRAYQWWKDATETELNPPALLPKGSMDLDDWDIRPGALNSYNVIDGRAPEFMQTNINLQSMWQSILDLRASMDDFFFVPQFRALDQISGSNPTATEVQEASKQGIQGIAPIIGTLEPEVYATIVERVLDLMDLNDLSVPKPEIMQDKEPIINVTTQLDAELQSSDVRRTMISVGQCVEIFKQFKEIPEISTLLDRDRLCRNNLYTNNVDPKAVYTKEEAEERQQELAAEQQKQQMLQMAMDKMGQLDPNKAPEQGSIAEGGGLGIGV